MFLLWDAYWKGKERTWSSGGEGERARYVLYIGNEEGPVELENRSCGRGPRQTIVSHCGGREMKGLLRRGDSV